MPKKLNEAEEIGQRVIMWNRATSDGFVPALCVVCKRMKTVRRSTALVWRSNKDAPACCARTAPHLVARIRELEKRAEELQELLVAANKCVKGLREGMIRMNASDCVQMTGYEEELSEAHGHIAKLEAALNVAKESGS